MFLCHPETSSRMPAPSSALSNIYWLVIIMYLLWSTYSMRRGGHLWCSLLGTALPGFRGCNPPWLRLRQSWDHKPRKRQSLSPWQKCHLCPLHPAWPWAWPVSQWRVRILKGGSTLRQALVTRDKLAGKDSEAIEKGGDGPSPLGFDIAWVLILSARSLLISWLPYFPCLT